ncbi:MAG: hypothetical protein QW780_02900 [Sulfolobales archaeon]
MFDALKKSKLKVIPLILILTVFSVSMWNWYDISIFENWVSVYKYAGLYKIYEVPLSLGNISYRVVYPPIPPLIYIGTHWLVDAFISVVNSISNSMPSVGQALLAITDHVVRGVMKLPLLAFTIALAIMLWRKFGSEAFYWIVMGIPTLVTLANYQFDPLVAFFLYLAIIGLELSRVGVYISSLSTALVILTKPLAAIPLIPLVYYVYSRTKIGGLIRYLTVTSVVVLILVLPFFLANPYAFIYNVILFHSGRAPQYVSLWNIFVLLSGRNSEVINLVNVVWLPVMLIAIVGTFLLLKKRIKMKNKDDVALATLVLLSIVLVLNKVVNPNYLLWAYPLIVHLAFSYRFKLRGTLLTFNVAAALATLWGGLYMLIPALVNDVVVIEETGELLPARTYIYKSLDTPLNETVQSLISLGERYYSYVKLVESYTNVIGAALILAYSLVMLVLIIKLINAARGT